MMRHVSLGVVAVALFACGGGSGGGGGDPGGLDTAFRGLWVGTFTFDGALTGSDSGQLAFSVAGNSAQIGYLCPDGTGTVTATGSGNTANWSGTLACAPTAGSSNCPAAVFTFSSLTSTLNGASVNVLTQGNLSGCPSGNGPFTLSFTGTH
jgi:hypothetical protein